LNLMDIDIGDPAMEHVGKLTSLESLNLTLTKVTDSGLTPLTGLKNLKSLGISQTEATEDGINRLLKALPNCKLMEEEE